MAKTTLPTREENFSEWYNRLVYEAGLAENSAVRGSMVIKPYGFAIWENMKEVLDSMFKATGHQNAYFPLFIPKSFFSKEAKHVEGFATECAVVTHYRLKAEDGQIDVDPEAKLEEELIVRPTSETIIWNQYKNWINSHRDLPILINQWANVVRWELRTRMFLRTAEFLWQEGHTAHATKEEALEESQMMHQVYQDFFRNFLAIDGVMGEKWENERFAGAENTYTLEAMMQDNKALQACTSHFLGQNFAKAFDVTYTNKENVKEHVWATSWGASTRMMWGLIMSHSDDQGLVLPPAIAPVHLAVVPIFKTEEDLDAIQEYLAPYLEEIENESFIVKSQFLGNINLPINVQIDTDDHKSPGWKYNEYELKGVPLRIAIGKRDMESGEFEVYRRDTQTKEVVSWKKLAQYVINTLETIQEDLLTKSAEFRKENTFFVDNYDDFKEKVEQGFVMAHWDGTIETELKIKEETKATIRCIPLPEYLENKTEAWKCIVTGKDSAQRVLFAKAY